MMIQNRTSPGSQGQLAFTMIEVALSLAIVAFALVAIMGVMPAGLNVQRENREETIISQDAEYLLEAIRLGELATNLDVMRSNITLMEVFSDYNGNRSELIWSNGISPTPPSIGQILVHFNRPSTYMVNSQTNTNYVRMRFRGFSGNMAAVAANTNLNDSFRYEVSTEIERIDTGNAVFRNSTSFRQNFLSNNLYSVKLNFRWPILPTGNLGSGQKTFHTQVRGAFVPVLFDENTTSFSELERYNLNHDNLIPNPNSGEGTNAGFVLKRRFVRTYR